MTQIIGIIFIAVVIIALILEEKKSSKEFYEKRIKDLENKLSSSKYQLSVLKNNHPRMHSEDYEEYSDVGYTSEKQFNDGINEIENNKYNSLECIYFESDLPDQLFNEVSLRVKTEQRLNHLVNKGITQEDINSAKDIINQREDILKTNLNLKSFVEDYINQKGKAIAEEKYLGLVKIFKVAGRDTSNSDKVYRELFEDLLF